MSLIDKDERNLDKSYYVGLAAAHIRSIIQKQRRRNEIDGDHEEADVADAKTEEEDDDDSSDDVAVLTAALSSSSSSSSSYQNIRDKLHRFKRLQVLPRVQAVIGVVKSYYVSSILDVASQRGALLIPLLEDNDIKQQNVLEKVVSIDIDPDVIKFWKSIESAPRCREVNFVAKYGDFTNLNDEFEDNSFECVICSEILEHLPYDGVVAATKEALRITSNIVICTVPAKPDNNVEHVQMFYFDSKPPNPKDITRDIQRVNQIDLERLWIDIAGASSCKVRFIDDAAISVLLAVIHK